MSATLMAALQAAVEDTHTIERALGRGGMGSTYLGHARYLDRKVVFKVLHGPGSDEGRRQRLLDEAQRAAHIKHPNIVGIFSYGAGSLPYVEMEYVEGVTLRQWLDARPGPAHDLQSAHTRVGIFTRITRAVRAVHMAGLVHCDVKPENIMVTATDVPAEVKLIDFGIARRIAGPDATSAAPAVGTPAYMAPEQLRHGRIGPAVDLYALGVVLYELLAGALPFVGRDTDQIAQAHFEASVPLLPVTDRIDLSHLDPVVARAMAKQPADRVPNCDALLLHLEAAVARLSAPAPDPVERAPLRRLERRLIAVVAARLDGPGLSWADQGVLTEAAIGVSTGPLAALSAAAVSNRPSGTLMWVLGHTSLPIDLGRDAVECALLLDAVLGGWREAHDEPIVTSARWSLAVVVGEAGVIATEGGFRVEGPQVEDAAEAARRADAGAIALPSALVERFGLDAAVPPIRTLEQALRVPAWRRLPATPMVGRDHPLNALGLHWSKVVGEGRPGVHLLIGPPGIGRRRLAMEFARRLDPGSGRRGPLISHTRCRVDVAPPFDLCRSLLGTWVRLRSGARDANVEGLRRVIEDRLPPERAEGCLSSLAHLLGRSATIAPPLGEVFAPAASISERIGGAMTALAAAQAVAASGLLWIIEGLDHIDAASVDVLMRLLGVEAPILVVGTLAEPDAPQPPWYPALRDASEWSVIKPLRAPEVEAYLTACSDPGDSKLAARAAQLHAWSGGNPLLLEELVRHLADGEAIGLDGIDARLQGATSTRLGAWLHYRMQRLTADERQVLRACAIASPPFSFEALAHLWARDRVELEPIVDALTRRGWLRPDHFHCVSPLCPHLRLAVPLVAVLVREAMGDTERLPLHTRWIEFVEQHPAHVICPPAVLADHYRLVRRHDRALAQWLEAAREARFLGQFEAASGYVAAAEEAHRRGAPSVAHTLALAGERAILDYLTPDDGPDPCDAFQRVVDAVDDALATAPSGDEPRARALLLRISAMAACRASHLEDALARCDRALDLLASGASVLDLEARASVQQVRSWVLYVRGAPGDAREAIEPLEAVLHRLGSHPPTAVGGAAHQVLATLYQRLEDFDSARIHCEHGLRMFRALDMPREQAMALLNLGSIHHYTGTFDDARACYDKARALFEQVEDGPHRAQCAHNLGDLAYSDGDLDEAARMLDEVLEVAHWFLLETLQTRAMIHFEQGEPEQGFALCRTAHDRAVERQQAVDRQRTRMLIAAGRADTAEIEGAFAELCAAGHTSVAHYTRAFAGYLVSRYGGEPALGASIYRQSRAALEDNGPAGLVAICRRWVDPAWGEGFYR